MYIYTYTIFSVYKKLETMPQKRMFVKQRRKSFDFILTQSTYMYMKEETRLAVLGKENFA